MSVTFHDDTATLHDGHDDKSKVLLLRREVLFKRCSAVACNDHPRPMVVWLKPCIFVYVCTDHCFGMSGFHRGPEIRANSTGHTHTTIRIEGRFVADRENMFRSILTR